MAHLDKKHQAILEALHGRELTGYRITKQIQTNGGEQVPIATLYIKLSELEGYGLVKHTTREDKRMIFSLVETPYQPGDKVRLNVPLSIYHGRVLEILEASPGGFLGGGHYPGCCYKVDIDGCPAILDADQVMPVDEEEYLIIDDPYRDIPQELRDTTTKAVADWWQNQDWAAQPESGETDGIE